MTSSSHLPQPCDSHAASKQPYTSHSFAALVHADEIPVIARLIKPVVVVRKDAPYVIETLAAGVTVDFDPVEGLTEVVCDGKVYIVLLKDLLEAAHPMKWEKP